MDVREEMAIGETADIQIETNPAKIVVNGQDLTRSLSVVDVHMEPAGAVVVLTAARGQSFAVSGPGIVKIAAQTPESPYEFLCRQSAREIEQQALNGLGYGSDLPLSAAILEVLKAKASAT